MVDQWSYTDPKQGLISQDDPMIPFPISEAVLADVNIRIAEYDAGKYDRREPLYAPEPEQSVITVPSGTKFYHGVWISAMDKSILFPEKKGNWIHLGIFPVISAFILLETLREYDWNYDGHIPVIFQLENTQDITAQYDTGGCDSFTFEYDSGYGGEEYLSKNGFGITIAPRYSNKDCSFEGAPLDHNGKKSNDSVSHWEFCINVEEKDKFKPVSYAIVDIEKLMNECNNKNLNILDVLYLPVQING